MNASSTITARSHAICSSLPPPTAIPLIRAIVGLPISRSRSCMSLKAPNHFQYSCGLPTSVCSQRAQVGADAERAALAGDDDDADLVVPRGVLAARAISRSIRKSNALRTSGRLSRIVARGGAFS